MKIIIEVDLDHQAFEANPNELAAILATVPSRIHGRNGVNLWTTTGHAIGTAKIVERPKGVAFRDGRTWRWRYGPFVGGVLTDAEVRELEAGGREP